MDKETQYLRSKTFYWVTGMTITVLIAIFGYTFSCLGNMESKVDGYQIGLVNIQSQLSQIQTDILWIKREFEK